MKQNSMPVKHATIISLGLFGRLSSLVVDQSQVLDKMRLLSGIEPRDSDYNAILPYLLSDLIGLTETLILSDKILMFEGFSAEICKTQMEAGRPFPRNLLPGWEAMVVFRQEADMLKSFIEDNIDVKNIYTDDHQLLDNNVFFEDKCYSMYLSSSNAWQEFNSFTDIQLGSEWNTYLSDIAIDVSKLPDAYFRGAIHPLTLPHSVMKKNFLISLYAEFKTSLAIGGTILPNWATGNYLKYIEDKRSVFNIKLRGLNRFGFNNLKEKLNQLEMVCFELLMPPLFRICLIGANSILDVIKNALRLRNEPWISKFRGYLNELSDADDPIRIAKKVEQIRDYMEKELAGSKGMGKVDIGFSISGPAISSSEILSPILMWRNPVVVFNSKVKKQLRSRDSFQDLQRIVRLPRSQLISAFENLET